MKCHRCQQPIKPNQKRVSLEYKERVIWAYHEWCSTQAEADVTLLNARDYDALHALDREHHGRAVETLHLPEEE